MAARTRKGTKDVPWDEKVRSKIQTSMLVNRLSDHVFGKVELTPSQVRSAEILLKKTVPDLSAVDASVNLSGEVTVRASKEQRDAAVSAALRADTDG